MNPEQIKHLRETLGWSLADFGGYFGVTAQAVLKWERGTAQPNDMAMATMIQLRRRLAAIETQQRKREFQDGLRHALISGGIVALLAYLFNQDD